MSTDQHRSRISWVDWILDRIDNLPGPVAIPYAVLFFGPIILLTVPAWMSVGTFPLANMSTYALVGFWTVFPLGLMHHLDRFSLRALEQFLPVCDLDEAELSAMRWDLSTMPSGLAATFGLIGIGIVLASFLVAPHLFEVVQFNSLQFVFALIIVCLNFALQSTLAYHTVRQLRLVSRIYGRARHLDLFNLRPLYAFATLAARTAIAWALALYVTILLFPQGFSYVFVVVLTLLQGAVLLAVFALPLLGIHRRIQSTKEEALAEVGAAMHRALRELNRSTYPVIPEQVDALSKLMASLNTGRDVLSKVPTWPWSPGTPAAVVSAVLFPMILFIAERLLGSLLGP